MSNTFNIVFWERYIREQFIRQVELFVESIEKRIIHSFDSMEDDAEKVQDEIWENSTSSGNPENVDEASLAEQARNEAVKYYEMLSGVRQSFLNICAASLYHFFEQQLIFMLRREILPISLEKDSKLFKARIFRDKLKEIGIDVTTFASWPVIEELRLVANTVKHAEGDSAEDLRLVNPLIFRNPLLDDIGPSFEGSSRWLFFPAGGVDLYVRIDDLKRYRDAIVGFWNDYISLLSKQDDP